MNDVDNQIFPFRINNVVDAFFIIPRRKKFLECIKVWSVSI